MKNNRHLYIKKKYQTRTEQYATAYYILHKLLRTAASLSIVIVAIGIGSSRSYANNHTIDIIEPESTESTIISVSDGQRAERDWTSTPTISQNDISLNYCNRNIEGNFSAYLKANMQSDQNYELCAIAANNALETGYVTVYILEAIENNGEISCTDEGKGIESLILESYDLVLPPKGRGVIRDDIYVDTDKKGCMTFAVQNNHDNQKPGALSKIVRKFFVYELLTDAKEEGSVSIQRITPDGPQSGKVILTSQSELFFKIANTLDYGLEASVDIHVGWDREVIDTIIYPDSSHIFTAQKMEKSYRAISKYSIELSYNDPNTDETKTQRQARYVVNLTTLYLRITLVLIALLTLRYMKKK